MAKKPSLRDAVRAAAFGRSLSSWRGAASGAADAKISTLRQQATRARQLKAELDDLLHVAENRLSLPRIGHDSIKTPPGADWSWRPHSLRGPLPSTGIASIETRTRIGDEFTVFHDCERSELTLRQLRNMRAEDLAPYGLRMDVFRFDGSFLSLVLDLPPESLVGLRKSHLIRLDTIIETEQPIEIYARLNLQHGPNTEQLVRELPLHEDDVMVEFDLAYRDFNEKRVEKLWVDLIFENPQMNQVTIRDLTFCRLPRAEL